MLVSLAGKVVVVTGAASGIGLAICHEAAGAGALLALVDRDADGLTRAADALRARGAEVAPVLADLAEASAPPQVIAATLARFGRVDGLVNAAALTSRASFLSGTPEVWDQLFAVNARAPFFLMQAAIADMLARRAPGAVVNILSMNALCGIPELAIYSATKGALATLTRNAAHAHMADRIRVNGINLGWVATPAEHHMQSVTLGRGPDWQEAAAATLPLKRLVTPEEVARLAVFMLSETSAPMSGSVVDFEQKVAGAI